MDLKRLHARLLLRLRQELFQQAGNRVFLTGIDLPERRNDQALLGIIRIHRRSTSVNWPICLDRRWSDCASRTGPDVSINVELLPSRTMAACDAGLRPCALDAHRRLRPIAVAQMPLDQLAGRRARQLSLEVDAARALDRR